jgi:hypothetical protein
MGIELDHKSIAARSLRVYGAPPLERLVGGKVGGVGESSNIGIAGSIDSNGGTRIIPNAAQIG